MSLSLSRPTFAVLGVSLLLMTGCASNGPAKESTSAIESMESASAQMAKAMTQVDKTNALLDELPTTTDLKKTFADYSAAVADLKASGEGATKRAAAMRAKRAEYLAKWEDEAGKFENATIKEAAEKRAALVRSNFQNLATAGESVRAAYGPYLADCTEIRTALSLDLSPGGVKAIQPAIAEAKTAGLALRKQLEDFNAQLAVLYSKMTPSGS